MFERDDGVFEVGSRTLRGDGIDFLLREHDATVDSRHPHAVVEL